MALLKWIASVLAIAQLAVNMDVASRQIVNSSRLTLLTNGCAMCPPGFGRELPCSNKRETHCLPCISGQSFSTNRSKEPCQKCSNCREDEYVTKRCTMTSDTTCLKCSTCKPGFGVVSPCTNWSDTVFGACPKLHDNSRPLRDGHLLCDECWAKNGQKIFADRGWNMNCSSKEGVDWENVVCKRYPTTPPREYTTGISTIASVVIGCAVAAIVVGFLVTQRRTTLKMLFTSAGKLREKRDVWCYAGETRRPPAIGLNAAILSLEPEEKEMHCSPYLGLRFVEEAEEIFNSKGGQLRGKDSDFVINVPQGTIPPGVRQRLFYKVVHDEGPLLRQLPEGPERTLISPVFECGPSDASLKTPVEIVVPHSLFLDGTKNVEIKVFRCGGFPNLGNSWEEVPSAKNKPHDSRSWFTVDKNTVKIRTKTFSFWSIFAYVSGSKRKRVTVFTSKQSSTKVYLRAYVYSDSGSSKKRIEMQERELYQNSVRSKEKPFRMFNDGNDVIMSLTKLEQGWELRQTPDNVTCNFESAYHNGYRVKDSHDFVVTATKPDAKPFSCIFQFKQENHEEHTIYVDSETIQGTAKDSRAGCRHSPTEEHLIKEDGSCEGEFLDISAPTLGNDPCSLYFEEELNEPVADEVLLRLCEAVGVDWRLLLRYLGVKEHVIGVIEEENHRVSERCYQGLLKWRKATKPPKATVGRLALALHHIGKKELADKLIRERNSSVEK